MPPCRTRIRPGRALTIAALGGALWSPTPPSARAADPQPYAVTIKSTGNAGLDGALRDSASLVALRQKAPVGPFALITRARADSKRLLVALRAYGYYRGRVEITIAGLGLDDPALPAALQARAAGDTAPVAVAATLGPQYRLGSVAVTGAVPADARDRLGIGTGDPALAAPVLAARANLLRALREDGHALAEVDAPVAIERDATRTLDVTIAAAAGPRVDIGPIALTGLEDVNPAFVRRRLLVRSGQLYQPSTIDAARQDLVATGVFASVRAEAGDALTPDGRIPITFAVKEAPRHTVGVTLGYSTDLGASTAVTWSDRNLFGNAEQLNLKAALIDLGGSATQGEGYDIDAQFIKPDLWRRDQTLTLNLEGIKQRLEAYDQTAILASGVVTRKLAAHWTGGAGLQGEQEAIVQEGETRDYTLAGVPLSVRYDDTDGLLAPTRGLRGALTATPTASLGGRRTDVFTVAQLAGSTYVNFDGDGHSVLALRATAATVQGATTFQIPPDQRVYAGGSATVRGYKYQSVGPQFPDHNPVGGTQLLAASVEMRQRVHGPFGLAVFADAGEVTGARGRVGAAEGPDTGGRLAVGAGAGVRYATPIGPIRVDVAVPLVRFPGGDSFEFYIGIGEAF